MPIHPIESAFPMTFLGDGGTGISLSVCALVSYLLSQHRLESLYHVVLLKLL